MPEHGDPRRRVILIILIQKLHRKGSCRVAFAAYMYTTVPVNGSKLTAPLLRELIDRIDVYEVTGTGKNRKQMIKIHYKFVGYLELPSLARQHNYREETRKGVAVEYVPNAQSA